MIKGADRNHLVTTGHEGWIGTEGMPLFETVHADKNIDYLTIHIWAKNWGWFKGDKLAEGFDDVTRKADAYIREHVAVSEKLGKPLVIEEFGLPRDGLVFDPAGATTFRDRYYAKILSFIGEGGVAGANFWAFGGTARPIKGQLFWKPGDDYMGDPPMEEQGLNTVFDGDRSTWQVIRSAAGTVRERSRLTISTTPALKRHPSCPGGEFLTLLNGLYHWLQSGYFPAAGPLLNFTL